MGGQVVENDADALGLWVMHVDEISHALREVGVRATVGDLRAAPRPVYVEEHEDVGRPVATVLVIPARSTTRCRRTRYAGLANQLSWRFVEANCVFRRDLGTDSGATWA